MVLKTQKQKYYNIIPTPALENGNPVTNYKDLLNYLLNISGTTLIKKLTNKPNDNDGRRDMELLWMPIIEGRYKVENFLINMCNN